MVDLHDFYEIEISDDHLIAVLKQKVNLSDEIDVEHLIQFIKEHGINDGINENILKDVINGSVTPPIEIATGKEPIDGTDSYLKPIIPTEDNVEVNLDEPVDLKQVLNIPSVTQGTVVGEKVEHTEGEPGFTIFGKELKAKPGRDMKLRAGKNTRVNKEGTKILATVDGQISVDRKVVNVYPVYEVNGDLDLKVGNIDFVGNVNIRGNVPEGFHIKTQGDIRIHGSVEGVTLEAGGSIFIHQGVVAQGKGLIQAKGDFKTSFINQGNIRVDRDVYVTQSILHSHIEAQGHVYCKQGRGNIVGGEVSAGKGIEVNEAGNSMHTPTSFYLGISERIINKDKDLRNQLETLESDLQKLGILYKKLLFKEKKNSLTAQDRIMKLRIQNSFKDTQQNIESIKDELFDIEGEFGQQTSAEMLIHKDLHQNTNIHFGKYRRSIVTNHKYVKFRLDQSEIIFESL
ncbi:FapA family protein [Bacillus shivajii]|uniref:DUF342 domain-containing protein n=1 Tax=Bacillus shivajii TaxID=1983719 RepID=UPI001CFA4CDE|nr:FapA family protein [Bacillus shivajii]UCZ51700.1 FapA family protein [Bacillus shivajii]